MKVRIAQTRTKGGLMFFRPYRRCLFWWLSMDAVFLCINDAVAWVRNRFPDAVIEVSRLNG